MSRSLLILALCCCQTLSSLGHAQVPPNLLRNGDFQSDWLTLLPDNKTLHWCYPDNWGGRRDYNPDAWRLTGSWRWENADAPRAQRQLVLARPKCEVRQSVNWVAVHDDRQPVAFADAGTPLEPRGRPPPGESRLRRSAVRP